jgi:signal transduction histidine kinase/ActR/RegA family two-component response regulator
MSARDRRSWKIANPVHRSAAEGHRVLITAPYGRDADSVAELLRGRGYDALVCLTPADLAANLDEHAGAILVTEEALVSDLGVLGQALEQQPTWSDIPFILLAGRQAGRELSREIVKRRLPTNATNVVLLERPLSTESLLSAIASAMRARQKQFLIRDQVAELAAGRQVLAEAARHLEQEVAARTADLEQALARLQAEAAERERAEAALRQSQKMEAVGQLTGGIAHDFNNMLTGVIGALDIMKRRIASGRIEDLDRFMDAAATSAQRAAGLTSRLLAFSRRQSLHNRAMDINELVTSLDDLLRRTMTEKINVSIVPGDDLPAGVADTNQLESAVINLAINARDAMPDGGKLTIETGAAYLDDTYCATHPEVQPGRYVVIAVSDTGVGMDKETLDKVFDPFFTTKPIGQGTGLGLSMVYGFAKQSNGQVRIHSALGAGTTVSIFLPAAEGAVEDDVMAGAVAIREGDGQSVLLVEDDESVRLLVREVLEELGYRALEAAEPHAASAMLQSGQHFDLMVTDVGLPGMNGRQLAEIAREHHPDLPILFVTGYAENAAIRAGFLGTNMAMITKPFQIEVLSAKISEMLSSEEA